MAHAAARRRGAARDEAGHRLFAAALRFVDQELRGLFFGVAADFADHDDRLGGVVGEEEFEHVDEVGAVDRVAADADRGRLAEADIRGLEHGFISQRARARDDADAALLEDVAGHDADLALVGGQHAGAVRADQARLRARERALHLDHVEHRNALGDRDDQLDLGVDRLEDRVGGERRRHIDDRRGRAGRMFRFLDGVEHRQADMRRAALARRHTADHLRTIGKRLFGVEGAGGAGHPLRDDLGILVDEDGHRFRSVSRAPAKAGAHLLISRRPPPCFESAGDGPLPSQGHNVLYARLESRPLHASSSSLTASTDT